MAECWKTLSGVACALPANGTPGDWGATVHQAIIVDDHKTPLGWFWIWRSLYVSGMLAEHRAPGSRHWRRRRASSPKPGTQPPGWQPACPGSSLSSASPSRHSRRPRSSSPSSGSPGPSWQSACQTSCPSATSHGAGQMGRIRKVPNPPPPLLPSLFYHTTERHH